MLKSMLMRTTMGVIEIMSAYTDMDAIDKVAFNYKRTMAWIKQQEAAKQSLMDK